MGEILAVEGSQGEARYEILKVEWKISSISPEQASLSQVVLRVRAQQ
jgi:hypothetical protein